MMEELVAWSIVLGAIVLVWSIIIRHAYKTAQIVRRKEP